MIATIETSEINGTVASPPSKSYTHRSIICAALANGRSKIMNPLLADDTHATIDVLSKIGVGISGNNDHIIVKGNGLSEPKEELFCKESGTTLRLMTSVCSLIKGRCKLTGSLSLLKRPIKPLVDALEKLGVNCSCNGNFPPVIVNNNLMGGITKVPGDISSQFISGLLLVAPLTQKETQILLSTELESKPYVMMTIDVQKDFGIEIKTSKNLRKFSVTRQEYKPRNYKVEGDWSAASFPLAAGAIAGRVEVTNIDNESLQADRKIIDVLKMMGASLKTTSKGILVIKSRLNAIDFDVSNCPDLFPIVCVLCSAANGTSKISGIRRLLLKESNRLDEMKNGLTKMGVKVKQSRDSIQITGSQVKGSTINSNDHRISMAFGILGMIAKGKTIIKNAECVSKSFPEFWNYLSKLNSNLDIR